MGIIRFLIYLLAAHAISSLALAGSPRAPAYLKVSEARSVCGIDLQSTPLVEVSSVVNGEDFRLEIRMKKGAYGRNDIQSVRIKKGAEHYLLPKSAIRNGSETTYLFSLGKNRIGFVLTAGSGEYTYLFLYRINTRDWHFTQEQLGYLSLTLLGTKEGVLEKVKE